MTIAEILTQEIGIGRRVRRQLRGMCATPAAPVYGRAPRSLAVQPMTHGAAMQIQSRADLSEWNAR